MGWTNADNKFGPTSFVVGPVGSIGNGVNYISIQQAISDASALGGPQDIYIRPGVYTENLVFPGNIYLIASSMTGDFGPPVANDVHVQIDGNHTVSGNSLTLCKGIFFNSAGATFTIEDSGGGVASVECQNCRLISAAENFILGGVAGNGSVKIIECDVFAQTRNIQIPTGAVGGFYEILNSNVQSNADFCVFVDSASSTGVVKGCSLIGGGGSPFTFDANSAGATLDIQNSFLQAPGVATITFQAAATVTSFHNTHNTGGSGEYITGPGNYSYGDDVVITGMGGTAGIDNAAVQTKHGVRPWAETGIYPTPSVIKGGAAFDETYFTCVDGQATLQGNVGFPPIYRLDGNIGSANPLPINMIIRGVTGCYVEAGVSATNAVDIYAIRYTSIIASGAAIPNFGHWITTTVTTTLPAITVESVTYNFIVTGAAAVSTIQAPAGTRIRIGNQISSIGGTAVSTSQGDTLRLVARLAPDSTFYAEYVIGNWVLT